MEIIKVLAIGIIGVIISNVLKNSNSTFAPFVILTTGMIIILMAISSMQKVLVTFNDLVNNAKIPSKMYAILLKIIGIGYLTEYSVSIAEDLDCKSIGNKIEFAGKISIFLLSIPILESLLDMIKDLI